MIFRAGPVVGAVLMRTPSEYLGLRLALALGAILSASFWLATRFRHKRMAAGLECSPMGATEAAHEHVREHPPRARCLVKYGADFADFLADLELCKALPYLADVARFEWALNIAVGVQEATPLPLRALAEVPANEAANVVLRLQPSLRYVVSPWPIDAIWQANQENEVPSVDLANGGARFEIRRSGNAVAWLPLDPATFAFRVALAEGLVLAAAMTAAIAQSPTFDIATAVRQIFADGLAVAYELSLDQKPFQPCPVDLARKESPE
jgi:hypothetical protein